MTKARYFCTGICSSHENFSENVFFQGASFGAIFSRHKRTRKLPRSRLSFKMKLYIAKLKIQDSKSTENNQNSIFILSFPNYIFSKHYKNSITSISRQYLCFLKKITVDFHSIIYKDSFDEIVLWTKKIIFIFILEKLDFLKNIQHAPERLNTNFQLII